jgi:predicted small secreted protein
MKYMLLAIATASLVSCNTSIGLWRDTKQAYQWTSEQIRGAGSGGDAGAYQYEAPVY